MAGDLAFILFGSMHYFPLKLRDAEFGLLHILPQLWVLKFYRPALRIALTRQPTLYLITESLSSNRLDFELGDGFHCCYSHRR